MTVTNPINVSLRLDGPADRPEHVPAERNSCHQLYLSTTSLRFCLASFTSRPSENSQVLVCQIAAGPWQWGGIRWPVLLIPAASLPAGLRRCQSPSHLQRQIILFILLCLCTEIHKAREAYHQKGRVMLRINKRVMFVFIFQSVMRNSLRLVSRPCSGRIWNATKGGLPVGGGLSMWSEWGSSLIPLSLGDGDQTGDPYTESDPPRSALKNSSLPWAGIIILEITKTRWKMININSCKLDFVMYECDVIREDLELATDEHFVVPCPHAARCRHSYRRANRADLTLHNPIR